MPKFCKRNCGTTLADVPDWWRVKPRPLKVCYWNKAPMLRAFREANQQQIEAWGGLRNKASGGEFDAINQKYGLKGKAKVNDLAGAIWHAAGTARPYCIDKIDIDALNETAPGHEHPFHLPHDVVEKQAMSKQYELSGTRKKKARRR